MKIEARLKSIESRVNSLLKVSKGLEIFASISSELKEAVNTGVRSKELEAELLKLGNPKYAYTYAAKVLGGPWPEAERIFLSSPEHALAYSAYILGKRWSEAEEVLKKHPKLLREYYSVFRRDKARPRTETPREKKMRLKEEAESERQKKLENDRKLFQERLNSLPQEAQDAIGVLQKYPKVTIKIFQ